MAEHVIPRETALFLAACGQPQARSSGGRPRAGALHADGQARHRLRQRREALGLSQRELAKRSWVHPTTLSMIESGKKNMGSRAAGQLAGALGVKREWLLTGNGPEGGEATV